MPLLKSFIRCLLFFPLILPSAVKKKPLLRFCPRVNETRRPLLLFLLLPLWGGRRGRGLLRDGSIHSAPLPFNHLLHPNPLFFFFFFLQTSAVAALRPVTRAKLAGVSSIFCHILPPWELRVMNFAPRSHAALANGLNTTGAGEWFGAMLC